MFRMRGCLYTPHSTLSRYRVLSTKFTIIQTHTQCCILNLDQKIKQTRITSHDLSQTNSSIIHSAGGWVRGGEVREWCRDGVCYSVSTRQQLPGHRDPHHSHNIQYLVSIYIVMVATPRSVARAPTKLNCCAFSPSSSHCSALTCR